MISAILAFFTAIPSIVHGIEAFTKAHYDAKVKIKTAQIGGDVDVAKQIISGVVTEGQARVEFLRVVSQSKFLMFLVGGFATPFMAYVWKVVMWDILIMAGTAATDPIKGNVADWGGYIIAGIFGTGGVMAAGQIFFNRKNQ
jgi:hypothetical protein